MESRTRELEQARARKERRIEAAKRSVRLKRAALKPASMPKPAKKLMFAALTHALNEEIAAIKLRYRRERQVIDRQHRRCQWTDWLRQEASIGNLDALAILRGRRPRHGMAGDAVTAEAAPERLVRPGGHDSVTRKGTIIYRVGDSAIRDDGARLKVSLGADQAALQFALRMAIARYGERLAVNGSDAFKEQILMAAVAGNMRVAFADAALEQRRLQLVRLSTAVEPKPVQIRQPAGRDGKLASEGAVTAPRHGGAARAVDRYITEREQKRVNGFDIPKHAAYTAREAGSAIYAGTRWVDGQALALLRKGDQVKVLEVDAATARRLKRLPLGAQVGVNAQGVIRAKGRSR